MKKINRQKKPKRLPSPPWQAQCLHDIIETVASVLGDESRGVFYVLPRSANAQTIRRAIIATHLLAAKLEEELAAVQ